jgi:phospholipase C
MNRRYTWLPHSIFGCACAIALASCGGGDGSGSGTAEPTAALAANPGTVARGSASTLTWSSTNATSCAASGGWNGAKAASGTQNTGALTANSAYSLTCSGPGGTSAPATASVTVAAMPTATLTTNPGTVALNGASTLTWSSTNATSCAASGGWSGAHAASGSQTTGPLAANTTYSLTCSGPGGTSGPATATVSVVPTASQLIKHIVIIVQENRSPDNLFHGLPGADIANSGLNSAGQVITLQQTNLAITYDLGHTHQSFEDLYDNGAMDGADKIACIPQSGTVCPSNPQFMYVDPAQVAPYFQLAEQYTFGDRMFQSNQGPSFPAHQFLIAGTSAPSVGGIYGDYFVAENPVPLNPTGCALAPDTATVALIDPTGVESASIYPCFDHPTLIDSLDNAGISWRYYAPTAGSIWTAPNAIEHLRNGPAWNNVIIPQSQVLTDITDGNLAQVAWVIPDGKESDHASITDGTGPSWVASVVNAIGNSPYWSDTAIIITWDDWGGWYDHVAPSIYNSYEYGLRVPLIIVSPFAKKGYVSHVTHDFGSILQFVEEVFTLPSLGYADARADNLADCFDFTQSVGPYSSIASPYGASFFINRGKTAPPTDPDDD